MQYDIILKKLYAELQALGLEKFATPLMEVTFPDGTSQKRFDHKNMNKEDGKHKKRYNIELENSPEDYFIKSENIGLEFAIHYINVSNMNVSNVVSEFDNVIEDTINRTGNSSIVSGKNLFIVDSMDDLIREFRFSYRSDDSDDKSSLYKALLNLKPKIKYDYNIVVLSDKISSDTFNSEWFLHDILGHTISLLNFKVPNDLFPIISDIFDTQLWKDMKAFLLKNNKVQDIVIDYITQYHNDDKFTIPLEQLITLAKEMVNNLINSGNLHAFLSNKMFASAGEDFTNLFHLHLKTEVEKLLKNLNAESHLSVFKEIDIGNYNSSMTHILDIAPTIIVGILNDKDVTRKYFKEFAAAFNYNNMIEIFDKIFNIFYEKIKRIIFYILRDLPINPNMSKAMPDINSFKAEYFTEFCNNVSFEKNMLNDYDKLEELTMNSLNNIKGKIVIADMTGF